MSASRCRSASLIRSIERSAESVTWPGLSQGSLRSRRLRAPGAVLNNAARAPDQPPLSAGKIALGMNKLTSPSAGTPPSALALEPPTACGPAEPPARAKLRANAHSSWPTLSDGQLIYLQLKPPSSASERREATPWLSLTRKRSLVQSQYRPSRTGTFLRSSDRIIWPDCRRHHSRARGQPAPARKVNISRGEDHLTTKRNSLCTASPQLGCLSCAALNPAFRSPTSAMRQTCVVAEQWPDEPFPPSALRVNQMDNLDVSWKHEWQDIRRCRTELVVT